MPDFPALGMSLPNVILNALLLLAIVGLWTMWWRNLRHQRHVELLLSKSIQQLEDASNQLEQTMVHIRKSQNMNADAFHPSSGHTSGISTGKSTRSDGDPLIHRMLQMQGKGESIEEIAVKLNLPLEQIRLMLKLRTAKS